MQSAPSLQSQYKGPDPVLAAALSVVPGCGQIYNGDRRKGLLFLLVTFFGLAPLACCVFSHSLSNLSATLMSCFRLKINSQILASLKEVDCTSPQFFTLVSLFTGFVIFAMVDAYKRADSFRTASFVQSFDMQTSEATSGSYIAHSVLMTVFFVYCLAYCVPLRHFTQTVEIEFEQSPATSAARSVARSADAKLPIPLPSSESRHFMPIPLPSSVPTEILSTAPSPVLEKPRLDTAAHPTVGAERGATVTRPLNVNDTATIERTDPVAQAPELSANSDGASPATTIAMPPAAKVSRDVNDANSIKTPEPTEAVSSAKKTEKTATPRRWICGTALNRAYEASHTEVLTLPAPAHAAPQVVAPAAVPAPVIRVPVMASTSPAETAELPMEQNGLPNHNIVVQPAIPAALTDFHQPVDAIATESPMPDIGAQPGSGGPMPDIGSQPGSGGPMPAQSVISTAGMVMIHPEGAASGTMSPGGMVVRHVRHLPLHAGPGGSGGSGGPGAPGEPHPEVATPRIAFAGIAGGFGRRVVSPTPDQSAAGSDSAQQLDVGREAYMSKLYLRILENPKMSSVLRHEVSVPAQVSFRIQQDGTISDVSLCKSSGVESVDRALVDSIESIAKFDELNFRHIGDINALIGVDRQMYEDFRSHRSQARRLLHTTGSSNATLFSAHNVSSINPMTPGSRDRVPDPLFQQLLHIDQVFRKFSDTTPECGISSGYISATAPASKTAAATGVIQGSHLSMEATPRTAVSLIQGNSKIFIDAANQGGSIIVRGGNPGEMVIEPSCDNEAAIIRTTGMPGEVFVGPHQRASICTQNGADYGLVKLTEQTGEHVTDGSAAKHGGIIITGADAQPKRSRILLSGPDPDAEKSSNRGLWLRSHPAIPTLNRP